MLLTFPGFIFFKFGYEETAVLPSAEGWVFTCTEKAVKIRTTLGINFIKGGRKSQAGPNEHSNTESFKVQPLISLTLFCLPHF